MNLNDVINATNQGYSENHNADSIRVDIPTTKSKEQTVAEAIKWDGYEMGFSAEEVARRWEEANTPEARERLRKELIERAKNRANLFQRSDGKIAVMVSGEPSWHELGYTMYADFTAKQIVDICLNWTYEIIKAKDEFGEDIPNLSYISLVDNEGDKSPLPGVGVTDRFNLVQPADFVDFSANIVDSLDNARFCAAGAVDHGKRIWTQARLPEILEPIRGDVTEHYVLFTDVFDGSGTMKVITTSERAVCQNTLRLADSTGSNVFSTRHTKNIKTRLDGYVAEVNDMRQEWKRYCEFADKAVKTQIDAKPYAKNIMDEVLGVTEAKQNLGKLLDCAIDSTQKREKVEKLEKLIGKRENNVSLALDTILDITESETNTARGSVWGAFNSVTQYANHSLRNNDVDATRSGKTGFSSLLMNGKADRINQLAYATAQNAVAN